MLLMAEAIDDMVRLQGLAIYNFDAAALATVRDPITRWTLEFDESVCTAKCATIARYSNSVKTACYTI